MESNNSTNQKCSQCPECSHFKGRLFGKSECSLTVVKISNNTCNLFLPDSKIQEYEKNIKESILVDQESQRLKEEARDDEVLQMPLEEGVRVTKSRAFNSSANDGYPPAFFVAFLVSLFLGMTYINIEDPLPRIAIVFISIVIASFWSAKTYFYKRAIEKKVADYLKKRSHQGVDVSEYHAERLKAEIGNLFEDPDPGRSAKSINSSGVCPNCSFLNDTRETHCQSCGESLLA